MITEIEITQAIKERREQTEEDIMNRNNSPEGAKMFNTYEKAIKNYGSAEEGEHVYVIINRTTGKSKIGYSKEPVRRLRNIINMSGCDCDFALTLQLEKGIDESAPWVERFLHDYYSAKRKEGEWFDLNISDLKIIEDLFWGINEYVYSCLTGESFGVIHTVSDMIDTWASESLRKVAEEIPEDGGNIVNYTIADMN